jgi:hypothetical protein
LEWVGTNAVSVGMEGYYGRPARHQTGQTDRHYRFQADERSAFLNLTTGEVVSVTDEELRAAENDEPLEDFLGHAAVGDDSG